MRKAATYEGMIENGRDRSASDDRIPEKSRAYILVPDAKLLLTRHVAGPHLADSEQAKDFQMQVIEDGSKPARGSNLFNK